MRTRPVGRRGVLLEAGPPPYEVAAAVRDLAAQVGAPLEEVVPGARTVLVLAREPAGLARLLAALPGLAVGPGPSRQELPEVVLTARYDGPDLASVAGATGLSVEGVVRRHLAGRYRAAFTGFAPGFAYLEGLDPALHLPRRDSPRPSVPAGSLALADTWTAVYPRRSPGGWHLVGTVDTPLFDLGRDPPALVAPGQPVRFVEARR